MGQDCSDKRTHFENLLPRLELEEDDFTDGADEDDADGAPSSSRRKAKRKRKPVLPQTFQSDGEGDENDDVPPIVRSASVHRIVFPPFVRVAGSSSSRLDASQPLQSYIPWATGVVSEEPDDSEELDEEVELEALLQELDEEEEQDERDQTVEKYFEEKLWEEFDVQRVKRALSEEEIGYTEKLRKRRRIVKTTEYVEEEDAEEMVLDEGREA